MLTNEKIDTLQHLLEEISGADDTYYIKMSDEEFEKASRRWDEPTKNHTLHQRQIGSVAFQSECAQRLMSTINDPAELQWLIENYNYDDGRWLPTQIINHPQCDIMTALTTYYGLQPDYIYEKYETLEQAKTDPYMKETAYLMSTIEDKSKQGVFQKVLPFPDHLWDLVSPDIDFTKPPYNKVPPQLMLPKAG